jgi:hypothetical protein
MSWRMQTQIKKPIPARHTSAAREDPGTERTEPSRSQDPLLIRGSSLSAQESLHP